MAPTIPVNRRNFRHLVGGPLFAAVFALGTLGFPAIASAERVWDIEKYDACKDSFNRDQMNDSINDQKTIEWVCCTNSGGVFTDDGYAGKCSAPPAESASQGSQQLPGNIQIPSDIATAPAVTQAPACPPETNSCTLQPVP
jgi:hypothetical protein